MNEETPINMETKRPLTAEELAEMKKRIAEAEAQQAAGEFLNIQEKAPQKPESFQVHPETAHVEKVDQMIGQHNEAGIPLPESIPLDERAPHLGKLLKFSPKEKAEAATALISSPPDTSKPGAADDLQHQMEALYSNEEEKAA